MNNLIYMVLQFLIAVTLIVLYYNLFELKRYKKITKKSMPVDLKVFTNMANVDHKKVNYNKLMNAIIWLNAIDVGLALLVTNITDKILLKILIAIPTVLVLLFISYSFLKMILKKKGMILDESQRDRK